MTLCNASAEPSFPTIVHVTRCSGGSVFSIDEFTLCTNPSFVQQNNIVQIEEAVEKARTHWFRRFQKPWERGR